MAESKNKNLKALLLAAGFGTRLGSLTKKVPKCLMLIGNRPLLGLWIEKLEKLGCEEIIINTHYHANQVNEFVSSLKSKVKIKLSYENELLGTAKTLMKHKESFREGLGLLIHADNYTNIDLAEFTNFHQIKKNDCLLSMVTFKTDNPKSCGIVSTDQNGIMIDFNEKPKEPKSNIANGAIYAFNYQLLEYIETIYNKEKISDFSKDLIPLLKNKVNTWHTKDFLIDIGTPNNLKIANQYSSKADL